MNIAKLNTASLDDKTFIIKRGTSGGGNSSINELYIKDIPEMMTDLLIAPFSYLAKCRKTSGEYIIITSASYFASFAIDPDNAPTAIAYMLLGNTEVMTGNGWQTISDIIATLGLELTYITKEQFYSLE